MDSWVHHDVLFRHRGELYLPRKNDRMDGSTESLLVLIPHACALGPLLWLIVSELFLTRIRARAVNIATVFLWVAGFSRPEDYCLWSGAGSEQW